MLRGLGAPIAHAGITSKAPAKTYINPNRDIKRHDPIQKQ